MCARMPITTCLQSHYKNELNFVRTIFGIFCAYTLNERQDWYMIYYNKKLNIYKNSHLWFIWFRLEKIMYTFSLTTLFVPYFWMERDLWQNKYICKRCKYFDLFIRFWGDNKCVYVGAAASWLYINWAFPHVILFFVFM